MIQNRSPHLDLCELDEDVPVCEVPETPETNKFLSDQTIRIKTNVANLLLESSRSK